MSISPQRSKTLDPYAVEVGQRLKERRDELGLDRPVLAVMVGCEDENLRQIEKGEHYPSFPLAKRLSLALSMSLDTDFFPEAFEQEFSPLRVIEGKVKALGDRSNSRSSEGSNRSKRLNQMVAGSSPAPGARELEEVAA